MKNILAEEALKKLYEGNRRFAGGLRSVASMVSQTNLEELASTQQPEAIILGCSDSRVPAEMIFDQGIGSLFVIRVAGNIVFPSQIGSIEFAAERFGTRLVIVLGHTNCGAINATIEELKRPSENRSPNLFSIVDRIRPAAETLLELEDKLTPAEMEKKCTRANIRNSVDHLKHGSVILEKLIKEDGLMVIGAEYCLKTGLVDFFDGMPHEAVN